jgi:pimeloyl-ACP methyl ester carboxylesterase
MPEATIIIGIHGLANKPPMPMKGEWWKASLIEGLQRNCGKTTNDLPFDFVYWADLRYQPPVSEAENPEPYWRDPSTGPLPAYRTQKWVEIINVATKIVGTEFDFLDLHAGVSQVGDLVLEKELTDLAAYYDDDTFRVTVRDRLKTKIQQYRDRRIMVIGHSMGSIIAYDVLRQLGRVEPQFRVDHFVTIGSPLGIPHVKYKISQENDLLRTPSVVGRWTNFADRRDVVAVDAKLADDYEPNDQGVRVTDVPVINAYRSPSDKNPADKPNYHKSYGYLRTPELSDVVRAFT